MKTLQITILTTIITIAISGTIYAQQPTPITHKDSVRKANMTLAKSDQQADKVKFRQLVQQFANSNKEEDVELAVNMYTAAKQLNSADSLIALAIIRFPKGHLAFVQGYNHIIKDGKTSEDKIKLYKVWIKEFPQQEEHSSGLYDQARYEIGFMFATESKPDSAYLWLNNIKSLNYRTFAKISTSRKVLAQNDTVFAEKLLREAFNNAMEGRPVASGQIEKSFYWVSATELAKLLYQEAKYKEALQYATIGYNESQQKPSSADVYALSLAATGKSNDALPILADLIATGQASDIVKNKLPEVYRSAKGTGQGYNQYLTSLQDKFAGQTKDKIAGQMIAQQAPQWTLKDLDGKTVSLADFKGKVVIIDFWATWCAPCKRSFPAMQMAVSKYKSDPNVKFLFIDTWEQGEGYLANVKTYIKSSGYSFHVLLDSNQTGVVKSFGVDAIPSKFVIDGKGIIRFKLSGFDGGNDAALKEISTMIEMAKSSS
jgi:thiol-disulfide isomerase/thioredoxin